IVTSVNGFRLERPTDGLEAFASLRGAESLDVEYLRYGEKMHLSLPILGKQQSDPPQAAQQQKSPQGGSAQGQERPAPKSDELP
ncbi:MAG: hypothetical protein MK135_10455, partial [Polyangiaceae bacterium]|nr:hypothetical protein [Polyangiaceae bacterium]